MGANKPNPGRRRSAKGNKLLPVAALLMALAVTVAVLEILLPQGSPFRSLPGMDRLHRFGDAAVLRVSRAFASGGKGSAASSASGSVSAVRNVSSPASSVSAAVSSSSGGAAQAQTVLYVGDSFTAGITLYHLQGAATVLSDTGMSAYKAAKGQITWQGKSVALADAVAGLHPTKVYLQLGGNDVTWMSQSNFVLYYGQLLDALRAADAGATVYVQSVFPVTAAYETGKGLSNDKIGAFNAQLAQLCESKGVKYLDVASALAGSDGKLQPQLSSDGMHLNRAAYQKWMDYLSTHS